MSLNGLPVEAPPAYRLTIRLDKADGSSSVVYVDLLPSDLLPVYHAMDTTGNRMLKAALFHLLPTLMVGAK